MSSNFEETNYSTTASSSEVTGGKSTATESISHFAPPPLQIPNTSPTPLTFSRIPGITDSTPPQRIQIGSRECTIADLLSALNVAHSLAAQSAINHISSLTSFNGTELHLCVSELISLIKKGTQLTDAAVNTLDAIVSKHENTIEGVNIAMQIVSKYRDSLPLALINKFTTLVNLTLQSDTVRSIEVREDFAHFRHLAVRALETTQFKSAGSAGITSLLWTQSDALIRERKQLATNVLAILRAMQEQDEDILALRKLCSFVFASGNAPKQSSGSSSQIGKPIIATEEVTSKSAERAKMYGLATVLETIKSVPFRGSEISLLEIYSLVRFGPSILLHEASNQVWPELSEWRATRNLLNEYFEKSIFPANDILPLFSLLAMHVKVENRSEARESKWKKDVVSAQERLELIDQVNSRCIQCGLSEEDLSALTQKLHDKLFFGEFHGWIAQTDGSNQPEIQSTASSTTPSAFSISDFLSRAQATDGPTFISRLKPEQLHRLGQLTDLSAENFRTIMGAIKNRAITCEWARGAYLELARAQHLEDVTVELRTNALGLLVSEARKVGKLTLKLEKDVFALSAELPSLDLL